MSDAVIIFGLYLVGIPIMYYLLCYIYVEEASFGAMIWPVVFVIGVILAIYEMMSFMGNDVLLLVIDLPFRWLCQVAQERQKKHESSN